jgi:hypothetical protein
VLYFSGNDLWSGGGSDAIQRHSIVRLNNPGDYMLCCAFTVDGAQIERSCFCFGTALY